MIDIVVERESRWLVERYCRGIKFVGRELGRIGALFAVSIVVVRISFEYGHDRTRHAVGKSIERIVHANVIL